MQNATNPANTLETMKMLLSLNSSQNAVQNSTLSNSEVLHSEIQQLKQEIAKRENDARLAEGSRFYSTLKH